MAQFRIVESEDRNLARVDWANAMLTASELARLLNVHINTVRRWSDNGLIKVHRIGPRGDRRFSQEDIASFLDRNPKSDNRTRGKTPPSTPGERAG